MRISDWSSDVCSSDLAGVAATFAMALGTAITVSALAILTPYSKRLALTAVGARQHWVEAAYRGLGLLGAGLLVALGGGLFWTSLGPSGDRKSTRLHSSH